MCVLTMGPCHPRTLSGAPQSPATGRRGSEVASPGVRRQHVISEDTGQQCTEMRSQYLRSQCRDNGFLTVQRNKVLVQTTGLNTTHVEGKIWRMSPTQGVMAFSHSVSTSYFSWMDGVSIKMIARRMCVFFMILSIVNCASLCYATRGDSLNSFIL